VIAACAADSAGRVPHVLIGPFGLISGQATQLSLSLRAEPQRQRLLPVGVFLRLLAHRLLAVLGGGDVRAASAPACLDGLPMMHAPSQCTR